MSIVFDTSIPKLDALRVTPFPARRAKVGVADSGH